MAPPEGGYRKPGETKKLPPSERPPGWQPYTGETPGGSVSKYYEDESGRTRKRTPKQIYEEEKRLAEEAQKQREAEEAGRLQTQEAETTTAVQAPPPYVPPTEEVFTKVEKAPTWYQRLWRTQLDFLPTTRRFETGLTKFGGFLETKAEDVRKFLKIDKYTGTPHPKLEKSKDYPKGVIVGGYEQIRERPVPTATMAGVGFALPGVLGATGAGLSKIPYVAKAVPIIGKVGGTVIAGIYGGSVVKRIYTAPTPEESGKETGRIITGELAPLAIGGYAYSQVAPRVQGYWTTRGREYVPTEQVIRPEVISGDKTFPTAPPSQHLKIIKGSQYRLPGETQQGVWHATGGKFVGGKIEPGSSEIAGLYTADALSAHFLRVKPKSYGGFSLDLFQRGSKPTAVRVYPSAIEPAPGLAKTGEWKKIPSGKWKRQFEIVGAEEGVAYVPKLKTEIEAVIPPGTVIEQVGSRYYTKFQGVRVPVEQFEVATAVYGKGVPGAKGRKVTTTAGEVSERYYVPEVSYSSPPVGYGSSPLATTVRSSIVSYSEPSSYVPPSSYIPPSGRPSGTSYTPPSLPPSRPPSKPPSKPPSIPPSVPPSYPPSYPPTRQPPIAPPKTPPVYRGIGAGGFPGLRTIKSTMIGRYTPSFTALAFKQFGRKPKGIATGIRYRPIPFGYSFKKLITIPTSPRRKQKKIIRRRKK